MQAVWGNQLFDTRDASGEVRRYGQLVHGFWIASNEKVELIPGIAESWSLSDDGLTWTFVVREGVKFHDGTELTAEDALFTMTDSFVPDAFASKVSGFGRKRENIELAGTNTVEFTLTDVDTSVASVLAESFPSSNYGAIMPKAYMEEVGREMYNETPIGAGAFEVVQFERSEKMTLERFDDFYYQPANGFSEDRRPIFQTIELRLVPESATRASAMEAGQADIIEANLEVEKQVERGGGHILLGPEATYSIVRMNGCWDTTLPCSNRNVRRALSLAIDKELIMSELYGQAGHAKGWDIVTPSSLGYSAELDPLPQDIPEAQRLLAEAGYPGGEGYPLLEIDTWVAGEMPFMPEFAQLIADMIQENLGIETSVKVGESGAVKAAVRSGQRDGHLFVRPNEARRDGGSSTKNAYGDFETKGPTAKDPVLRDLVLETLAIQDSALKHDAYNKMYRALREEQYAFGVGYVDLSWGVGPRIASWDPWPMNSNPTAWWTITLKEK
jgi:peptide/nickel transport system substrate-binding protein